MLYVPRPHHRSQHNPPEKKKKRPVPWITRFDIVALSAIAFACFVLVWLLLRPDPAMPTSAEIVLPTDVPAQVTPTQVWFLRDGLVYGEQDDGSFSLIAFIPPTEAADSGVAATSPDGRWVAVRLLNPHAIHVHDLAGNMPMQKMSGLRGAWGTERIAWSPDSTWITYDVHDINTGLNEIVIASRESGYLEILTQSLTVDAYAPVWTQDRRVVYRAGSGDEARLWAFDLDAWRARPLAATEGVEAHGLRERE